MLLRSLSICIKVHFQHTLQQAAQSGRRLCTESNSSVSSIWRNNYIWTSPVKFTPGTQTPTALQWVKRRGPAVHHGYLRSLFRKGKIKLFLPATQQIKAVTERAHLIAGDQILIPKEVSDLQLVKDTGNSTLDLTTSAALKLVQQLRASLLYKNDDVLIINKPQGLAVQGGPGIGLSLDKVMATALQCDAPEPPRLVHRLDKDASGCLVIARTADSAAWLSLAFAQHAKSVADAASIHTVHISEHCWFVTKPGLRQLLTKSTNMVSTRQNTMQVTTSATVQRQYIALVQQSPALQRAPHGTIKESLIGRAGILLPASTVYHTLHSNEDFALLQLTPKTGRKHQLRIHCANVLSAPIVGDARYGSTRSALQRKLLADLKVCQHSTSSHPEEHTAGTVASYDPAGQKHPEEDSYSQNFGSAGHQNVDIDQAGSVSTASLMLQLHAHSICIRKPLDVAIKAQAEPAGQMQALLDYFSWMPHLTKQT